MITNLRMELFEALIVSVPPLYTLTILTRYECQIIVAINNKVTQSLFLRVEEPPIINDNSTRSIVVNEFEVSYSLYVETVRLN